MRYLSDEEIDTALADIRTEFESRNNKTGLEILDNYETQWDTTGTLSDRQRNWLDRQIDGSWKKKSKADVAAEPDCDMVQIPPTLRGFEAALEAMLFQKLETERQKLVDVDVIKELDQHIDYLQQVIKSLQ